MNAIFVTKFEGNLVFAHIFNFQDLSNSSDDKKHDISSQLEFTEFITLLRGLNKGKGDSIHILLIFIKAGMDLRRDFITLQLTSFKRAAGALPLLGSSHEIDGHFTIFERERYFGGDDCNFSHTPFIELRPVSANEG